MQEKDYNIYSQLSKKHQQDYYAYIFLEPTQRIAWVCKKY